MKIDDDIFEKEINSKGNRCGKGVVSFEDGTVYEGDCEYGLANGFGKATYPDGIIYEGNFQNGKRQGRGEIKYKGISLFAIWENDTAREFLEFKFPDGTIVPGRRTEGDRKNGRKANTD